MDNLEIYNKVRSVPREACKPISAGRLKGMTEISPMWRIKILTELFGICGQGWYTEIIEKRLESGGNGEVVAIVDINLYIKFSDGWGKPIAGTGGSKFIAKESSGLYTSDEAFKMAYTDALSVACKALGIGADVYFDKDKTKYSNVQETEKQEKRAATPAKTNPDKKTLIVRLIKGTTIQPSEITEWLNLNTEQSEVNQLSEIEFAELTEWINKEITRRSKSE